MIKKKNDNKIEKILVIILNIVGIICLIYFSIPFLKHDMTIRNPNAMLASLAWDECGFVLTIGLIPLVIANAMAFIFSNMKKKILKILFFIPSLICLILVSSYLFMSFNTEEGSYTPELVDSAKYELNGKIYNYSIYKEQDGTYSVEMDDNDKIPQNVIDYESPEKIFETIENYYKDNGGTSL